MPTVKYFYIDDDTAVLFGANGTALTTSLVGASGIISDSAIALPTFPLWCYLAGLVLAFVSKAVINLYNSDIRAREQGQNVRDVLIEARQTASGSLKAEIGRQWALMERHRGRLLSESAVRRLNVVRAYCYLSSAMCFVIGTYSIISFVGSEGVDTLP